MRELQTVWGPELFGAFLVLFGAACLFSAPRIQRDMLRLAGAPRTRLASWSLGIARSPTALRSIRTSGLLMVVVGLLLCAAPFLSERM